MVLSQSKHIWSFATWKCLAENSSRQRAGFCSIKTKKNHNKPVKGFLIPWGEKKQYTNIKLVRDAHGIHLKWWICQHNEETAEPRVCCQCVGGVNRWSKMGTERPSWVWRKWIGCCHRSRVSSSIPVCSVSVCREHLAVYSPVCTHSTSLWIVRAHTARPLRNCHSVKPFAGRFSAAASSCLLRWTRVVICRPAETCCGVLRVFNNSVFAVDHNSALGKSSGFIKQCHDRMTTFGLQDTGCSDLRQTLVMRAIFAWFAEDIWSCLFLNFNSNLGCDSAPHSLFIECARMATVSCMLHSISWWLYLSQQLCYIVEKTYLITIPERLYG